LVKVRGLAISDRQKYSDDEPNWPVLCISSDGRAQILQYGGCSADAIQALAGNHMLVEYGVSVAPPNSRVHPRTAVAVDAQGQRLWLIVVDGRQRYYSEGVTLGELAEIVLELGADIALNLDGGGSSTLVVANAWGAHTLNAPIHTYVPMRQRPVGNHLGIYALPVGK
jgi:exopolysaccharide biosynthesis protein